MMVDARVIVKKVACLRTMNKKPLGKEDFYVNISIFLANLDENGLLTIYPTSVSYTLIVCQYPHKHFTTWDITYYDLSGYRTQA